MSGRPHQTMPSLDAVSVALAGSSEGSDPPPLFTEHLESVLRGAARGERRDVRTIRQLLSVPHAVCDWVCPSHLERLCRASYAAGPGCLGAGLRHQAFLVGAALACLAEGRGGVPDAQYVVPVFSGGAAMSKEDFRKLR